MVYDDIIAYISGEYRKGKTYQKIADEHGLSFGYIRDLLHGRNKVERMSLETFFKLFPSAQILLNSMPPNRPVAPFEQDRLESERSLLVRELEIVRIERDSLRRELETQKRLSDVLDARVRDLEARPPAVLDGPGSRAPYPAERITLSTSNK